MYDITFADEEVRTISVNLNDSYITISEFFGCNCAGCDETATNNVTFSVDSARTVIRALRNLVTEATAEKSKAIFNPLGEW